ncbi:hypothetical protein ROZALSC1DRAFT_23327 [Rozella allomycis CSF55]|uniref:Uncharacterized protein n=1 Tax=Rozella allomycis (strain CSF55) TaxID=988480 RepID=A0A4P9YFS5_ROZAC|nr:hypothetical protein ROZALSC1DRAFT_23327 [Rozella allomycis CSF55]
MRRALYKMVKEKKCLDKWQVKVWMKKHLDIDTNVSLVVKPNTDDTVYKTISIHGEYQCPNASLSMTSLAIRQRVLYYHFGQGSFHMFVLWEVKDISPNQASAITDVIFLEIGFNLSILHNTKSARIYGAADLNLD